MPAVIHPDFPTDDPYYRGQVILHQEMADSMPIDRVEDALRVEFDACLKDTLREVRQDRKLRGVPPEGC